jgi:hypothetical protein
MYSENPYYQFGKQLIRQMLWQIVAGNASRKHDARKITGKTKIIVKTKIDQKYKEHNKAKILCHYCKETKLSK